jgi:hypothetical protein
VQLFVSLKSIVRQMPGEEIGLDSVGDKSLAADAVGEIGTDQEFKMEFASENTGKIVGGRGSIQAATATVGEKVADGYAIETVFERREVKQSWGDWFTDYKEDWLVKHWIYPDDEEPDKLDDDAEEEDKADYEQEYKEWQAKYRHVRCVRLSVYLTGFLLCLLPLLLLFLRFGDDVFGAARSVSSAVVGAARSVSSTLVGGVRTVRTALGGGVGGVARLGSTGLASAKKGVVWLGSNSRDCVVWLLSGPGKAINIVVMVIGSVGSILPHREPVVVPPPSRLSTLLALFDGGWLWLLLLLLILLLLYCCCFVAGGDEDDDGRRRIVRTPVMSPATSRSSSPVPVRGGDGYRMLLRDGKEFAARS